MKAQSQTGFPWAFVVLTYGFTWLILLPAVLATFTGQALPFPFWEYLIAVSALSVLFTWIYKSTGKKLLAALLFPP